MCFVDHGSNMSLKQGFPTVNSILQYAKQLLLLFFTFQCFLRVLIYNETSDAMLAHIKVLGSPRHQTPSLPMICSFNPEPSIGFLCGLCADRNSFHLWCQMQYKPYRGTLHPTSTGAHYFPSLYVSEGSLNTCWGNLSCLPMSTVSCQSFIVLRSPAIG